MSNTQLLINQQQDVSPEGLCQLLTSREILCEEAIYMVTKGWHHKRMCRQSKHYMIGYGTKMELTLVEGAIG